MRLAKLVQMRFWQIHFDLDQILKLLCRHFQMKKNFPSRSSSYSKPGQNGCNKLVALLEETIMIMNIVCIIVCLWSQYPERTLSHFIYYKNLKFINVLRSYIHMHGWLVHCGYCQANITCRTSSNPDLIQNYFLSTEIFSLSLSLDIHSEQMSQCASHSCLRNVFFVWKVPCQLLALPK